MKNDEPTHWKDALAKSGISYSTDAEYEEAMQNLVGFFDILLQIELSAKKNQDTLISEVDSSKS